MPTQFASPIVPLALVLPICANLLDGHIFHVSMLNTSPRAEHGILYVAAVLQSRGL